MALERIDLSSSPTADRDLAHPPAPPAQQEGRYTEWLLRSFAVLLLGYIVFRWGYVFFEDRTRWTALLLLISEGFTLGLVLFARKAAARDLSAAAMVVTVYAMLYPALLQPGGTTRLAPEWIGVGLQLAGMAWQFVAKVYLGRSFGLLPAQRGLVVAGPYRLMRHPIYFGYVIGHIGFLLANFSLVNLLVLVLLYAAQVVRLLREEAVLAAADPAYRDYQQRVRWHLVPYVF